MAVLRRRYVTADMSRTAAEQEFLNRTQRSGESVADWVADLQRLAAICRFGPNSLNGRLKAQLIRGAADVEARKKLIRKSSDRELLTLDRTLEILRSYEAANAELNQNTLGTTAGQAWAAVHNTAGRQAQPPPAPMTVPVYNPLGFWQIPAAPCMMQGASYHQTVPPGAVTATGQHQGGPGGQRDRIRATGAPTRRHCQLGSP